MQKKVLAAALAALVLSGCAVTNQDVSEMTRDVTPGQWSAALPKGLEEGSVERFADFWKRWSDPTLAALVERAQNVNTDVLTAAANLRAARASLLSANSALWPSFNLSAGADRRRASGSTSTGYSAGLDGSWTLGLGGSEFFTASAAEARALAAEMSLADMRELVAAETAQAYVNLRTAEATLKVVRESVANYAATADTARWQYASGMGSAAEAEDALTQLAAARARIPQLEQSITEYRNALARLTAQAADRLEIGEGAIPVPPEGCAAVMPAELLERRADVRSGLHELEASILALESAERAYFPSLGFTGNIGTDAATIGALGASGTGVAGLAAALALPVINWGALEAAEESARAEVEKARASYVSVLLGALEEADNALSGISRAEEREVHLTTALGHARIAARLAKQEYEAGIGDYTMVLSTERSLLSAEESLLGNRSERANQYVMLYRAVGGGWAVEDALKAGENKNETKE